MDQRNPIQVNGRNVNTCYPLGLWQIKSNGIKEESRYGTVLRVPAPVLTAYYRPKERVLFDANRDANPFFHLMEALWMLAGRKDVAFVAEYVKRMAEFSDNGIDFHAAYGYRWRQHWGFDQLTDIISILKQNPGDRRIVLEMWDADVDLNKQGKDFPCNTHIYFSVVNGALDMTVCNRSNDIIWGLYGANAVHMSVLQEYVATMSLLPVGQMYTLSNNFHAYLDVYNKHTTELYGKQFDPYDMGDVDVQPLVTAPQFFDEELERFMADPFEQHAYKNSFFQLVAQPMNASHAAFKRGDFDMASEMLDYIPHSNDWQIAARLWLNRRRKKANG